MAQPRSRRSIFSTCFGPESQCSLHSSLSWSVLSFRGATPLQGQRSGSASLRRQEYFWPHQFPLDIQCTGLLSANLAWLSNQTARLYLDAFGEIDADLVSCCKGTVGFRLRPTSAQHKQLVVKLFGGSPGTVSDKASMGEQLLERS